MRTRPVALSDGSLCRRARAAVRIWAGVALLTALASCGGGGDGPSGTPGPGQPTSVAILSAVAGSDQAAPAGTTLPNDVVVNAKTPFNLMAAGVTLAASANSGGAVTPATATTDADGVARFQWTLGRAEGAQSLTVTPANGGTPVIFVASATRPAVASVLLTPVGPLPSMIPGDTTRVTARAFDALSVELPDRVLAWSSSNPTVVSVATAETQPRSRLLTATGPGAAVVTVTSEGKTASVAVTVTPAPVTSVTIAQTPSSVVAGQTVTLTATPRDLRGVALTGRTVRWRSATPTIASIDSITGLATGITGGTTLITATSEGVSSTAVTLTVTNAPVASVTITPASPSVRVGQTVALNAELRDAAGTVLTGRVIKWTSQSVARATIDSSTGLASGVSTGTTTITAASEGRSGSTTLTVTPAPVASVDITPGSPSVPVGQTVQMTASPRDAAGNVLTGRGIIWSSSNAAVATINTATGLASGVRADTATLTATSEGRSGSVTLTVTPAPVATVTVTPTSPISIVGGTVQLTAVLRDAAGNALTGRTITWSSLNAVVATVNSSGLASGISAGTTTISATSEGRSGGVTLFVPVPVASVTITPTSPTVASGQTLQLNAQPRDAAGNALAGRTITWSSSNTAAATVSSSGLASGLSPGTATITATSDGVGGSATLSVTPAPVAQVRIQPQTPLLLANGTLQFTAALTDAGGNVLTGRSVAWSSSNSAVAGINPTTGDALAVSVGTATITATSEGQTGSVTLRVQPTFACGGAPALGCGLGAEQFVTIPATVTPFLMGSNRAANEQPVHAVSITQPFALQRTEVTQGQWRAVMGNSPSFFTACGDLCPVEQVSWEEVQLFISRLNAVTPGGTYRLPTEAEWEYAVRAGSTAETYGPIFDIAWYSDNNTPNGTKRVATKAPNSRGLYDMLGNVYEWVNDWYSATYYSTFPGVDPPGPTTGTSRVLRGGSWGNSATVVRAGFRFSDTPWYRNSFIGFRLVRTP